jgi:hypothetical protein
MALDITTTHYLLPSASADGLKKLIEFWALAP